MTSVVPERASAATSLEVVLAPPRSSSASLVADTRWLRRLGRRLMLLDAAIVAIAVIGSLAVRFTTLADRFGGENSRISLPDSLRDIEPSSYYIVSDRCSLSPG